MAPRPEAAEAANSVAPSAMKDESSANGSAEIRETVPSSREAPPSRRRYEAPRILYREPLEAMAAVCAPTPPAKSNPGFCPQGPISS